LSDQQTENELNAKGLNAPRLRPADIENTVVHEQFWNPPGTTLTVAVLTLRNGSHVIGESACVSPENFDAKIGARIARENAVHKIWALEGYLLKQRLSELKVGDKVVSIKGADVVGVTGVLEIIRSHDSYGVRTDSGDLWHEHPANWMKVS
jgi:hypothetical protein